MDKRFALYTRVHHHRANLLLHILTVPLFMAGTVALALAWHWHWLAAAGPAAILAAMAAQGRGHAHEAERPAPFAGPLDVVRRIFVEQWVTFPRFVASGSFARAWRGE
jgi:hypothetical protein